MTGSSPPPRDRPGALPGAGGEGFRPILWEHPLAAGELRAEEIDPMRRRMPVPIHLPGRFRAVLQRLENAYIDAALADARQDTRRAGMLLGMGRSLLEQKLRSRSATPDESR